MLHVFAAVFGSFHAGTGFDGRISWDVNPRITKREFAKLVVPFNGYDMMLGKQSVVVCYKCKLWYKHLIGADRKRQPIFNIASNGSTRPPELQMAIQVLWRALNDFERMQVSKVGP